MATADAVVAPPRQLREVSVCAAVATAASCAVVLLVPRGGDLAAHLYRTGLVRHGVLVWDNLWFAGQYPLASYSLLYYLLAALVGNAALGIAGVVAAAAIFASVAQREWSSTGRWPARVFAVLLAGQAFTAAYPYDLGLSALLGTLWALQRRRTRLAVCCTLLTLGFSPLAFVFLALTLVALFLHRRRITRRALAVGAAVAVAGGLQLTLLVLLPTPGLVFPYGAWRLLAGLAVATLGATLAIRSREWVLANLFLVWAVASVGFYLVPSPIGHNFVRASVFVVPLMLVASARAGFRPRWLALVATAAAVAANVAPYAPMISVRSSSADGHAAFWRPVVRFLDRHPARGFRVEAVSTANHWETYFLPRAGFALARGWYRQLDMADNHVLYGSTLTPARYRSWLSARAVRYVVLPDLPLEATDAPREAALLRSGRSGLREAGRVPHATIYELPHATPLITGLDGASRIGVVSSNRITGWVGKPGTYLLRVNFSPWWRVDRSAACLTPARGGMTLVHAARAGRFTIRAIESPTALITALFDADSGECPSGRAASPGFRPPAQVAFRGA